MFKIITYTINGNMKSYYSHVDDKEGLNQIALLAEIFDEVNKADSAAQGSAKSKKYVQYNILETDTVPDYAQCIL